MSVELAYVISQNTMALQSVIFFKVQISYLDSACYLHTQSKQKWVIFAWPKIENQWVSARKT